MIQQDLASMKIGTDGVLLGAWVNSNTPVNTILDIGTGTGLIALMMAQKYDNAIIDAIDIEDGAIEQTRINVSNSIWKNRIHVFHSDLENFIQNNVTQYDIIVCNPPYFLNGWDIKDANRKKARDGIFLPPEHLIKVANQNLSQSGTLNLILPAAAGDDFVELIKKQNLFCSRRTRVKTKENKIPKRVLLEIVKTETATIESELIIEHDRLNNYTNEYKALTRDFYLNF